MYHFTRLQNKNLRFNEYPGGSNSIFLLPQPSLLRKLIFFIGFTFLCHTILSAQTVIESWAILPSASGPRAIVTDAAGNVYTANNLSTVSKVTPAGVLTTTELAVEALPIGIAVDASGDVYTANIGNNTISKITAAGTATLNWAILAAGSAPRGIAVDASGNVYTANKGNSTISKITPAGAVTQAWATLAVGANPYGIALDASGNVYSCNTGNGTVSKISASGTVVQVWAVGANPNAIAIDVSGNIYTTELITSSVSKITPAGVITYPFATVAPGPTGLIVDASGNVYTANNGVSSSISKVTPTGTSTLAWVSLNFLTLPEAITIDATGIIYTANFGNETISKITPSSIALPVNIISFNGRRENGGEVLLQWQTADEVNLSKYIVEYSNDGRIFSELTVVAAKNGSYINNYHVIDNSPDINTIRYYRLKMVDIDGRAKFSTVIKLNITREYAASIYPNPVNNVFTLSVKNKLLNTNARITDAIGQTVMIFNITNNYQNININHFAKGIYKLLLADGSLIKIIKQ